MAQRKPVIIDGCITDVLQKSTLADIVPRDVVSVQTHDGRLVKREDFARVPVPEGFETNLSPINKGAQAPALLDRRRLLCLSLLTVLGCGSDSAQAGLASAVLRRPVARKLLPKPADGRPHDVVVRRSEHPEAAAHIDHAQRQGQPSMLHIDRAGAAARRSASTSRVNLETRPGQTFDRDEYPPAFTREGGANANVRFIPRSDNRGSGSSLSHQTRELEDGSKIRVIVTD